MNQTNNNNFGTRSRSVSDEDIKSIFSRGFFGSSVMEDENFLKIMEKFDYSGEEAAKALEFSSACMNYLMGGLD